MVQRHTISAPDDLFNQVRNHAEKKGKTISEFTRLAWEQYFKKYRIVDVIIVLLLISIFVTLLLGAWIL